MPLFGRKRVRLANMTSEHLQGAGVRFRGKLVVGVTPLPSQGLFEESDPSPQERALIFSTCMEAVASARQLQKKSRRKKTKVILQLSTDSGVTITKRSSKKELASYTPSNLYLAIPDPSNERYCAFVVRGIFGLEVLVYKAHKKTKVVDLCSLFNCTFEETGRQLRDRARRSQLATEAANSIRLRSLRRKSLRDLDNTKPDTTDVARSSVREEEVVRETEAKSADPGDKLEVIELREKPKMDALIRECAIKIQGRVYLKQQL